MLIKYFFFLLLNPQRAIPELAKEKYLMNIIFIFFIIGFVWWIMFAKFFDERTTDDILINPFKNYLLVLLSLSLFPATYYGFVRLFRGIVSFKGVLQLMLCIGIIGYIFFQPLYLIYYFLLPLNWTTEWLGRITAFAQFIWIFVVLKDYGEIIVGFGRNKSFVVSAITLIIFVTADISIFWFSEY